MKVSGSSGPSSAGGARAARPQSAAPGFAPITSSSAPEAAGVSGTSGVTHVSSLEALIALQDVGGPLERRRRSVRRAGGILDALEKLKVDLLEGGLSRSAVESLARAVHEQPALTDDPALEGLLDEIETRAAVEMAKLERVRLAA